MDLPPLDLPHEILDDILSNLDRPRDILCFALTSRVCAQLAIPSHIEYRIIRVRELMPEMWAHLALRSDLAKNIREVAFCFATNDTKLDRFPKTLVNNSEFLPGLPEPSSQATTSFGFLENGIYRNERLRNVCLALHHMKRLRSFVWKQGATSNPDIHLYEDMMLEAVSKAPGLRRLMLDGHCGALVSDGLGVFRTPYPLFSIHNLESLSLVGVIWLQRSNHLSLLRMLQHSPSIKELSIPAELSSLIVQCRFPTLKRLVLPTTSTSRGDQHLVMIFLSSHPTIEELQWYPFGNQSLPMTSEFGFLPNLRHLQSNGYFMHALEVLSSSRALSPSSTTVSLPIERLRIYDFTSQQICTSNVLDSKTLRKVEVLSLFTLDSFKHMAERFTQITWLSVPGEFKERHYWAPTKVTPVEWRTILPLLTNLEVLRGRALWDAFRSNENKEWMRDVIFSFAELCPKLKRLDHWDGHTERWSQFEVRIFRKGDESTGGDDGQSTSEDAVWYEVRARPLR